MINTANTCFAIRPKTLDGIGMAVTQNVNLFGVGDGIMLVSHRWKSVINSIFVGINHCFSGDIFTNYWKNGFAFGIGDSANFKFSASLNDSKYSRFSLCSAPTLALTPTAKVTFINFDFTSKWAVIFVKALVNLLAHAPSGFVSNASFPLNLFSRDTATSLRHQVNNVKPSGQWGARFVKNCVSSWTDLVSAEITSVRFAPTHPFNFGDRGGSSNKRMFLSLQACSNSAMNSLPPSTCIALIWKGIRSRTVSRNRLAFLAVARLHTCSTHQREVISRAVKCLKCTPGIRLTSSVSICTRSPGTWTA